jgi:Fe2+ transport system protein FeoA
MSIIPLSVVPPGTEFEISEFHSGRTHRKRLAEMGIFIGTVLRVCYGTNSDHIVLCRCGDKFSIGRGMADKIFVKIKENPEPHKNCKLK